MCKRKKRGWIFAFLLSEASRRYNASYPSKVCELAMQKESLNIFVLNDTQMQNLLPMPNTFKTENIVFNT